jgi:hypothetical protein
MDEDYTFGQFKKWSSTPRFHKGLHITMKIDGTNGGVSVEIVGHEDMSWHYSGQVPEDATYVTHRTEDGSDPGFGYLVRAQSRKRIITPTNDNYGFAGWVWDNAEALANTLGMGYHYGEWYGEGIQGNPMGVAGRKWALFNTWHWARPENAIALKNSGIPGITHVPVLHDEQTHGPADYMTIPDIMDNLYKWGDLVEGYRTHPYANKMDSHMVKEPEGIIVWHRETQQKYKILLNNDSIHKGQQ